MSLPSCSTANRVEWDVIVIGAGLAGAISSYLLARQGRKVLLVDAKRFPRPKVCGGCLNARAISVFQEAGLGELLQVAQAEAYDSVRLCADGRSVRLPIPPGIAVTRETLDELIVDAACQAGVTFIAGTAAHVLPREDAEYREVRLGPARGPDSRVECAGLVLACDGLGRPSLSELPLEPPRVSRHSRVGLGAVVAEDRMSLLPEPKSLLMAVGKRGYVGFSRCESGKISIAAAVDRGSMGVGTTPAEVIRNVLNDAGIPTDPGLTDAAWRGTKPLSQRSTCVSYHRLLLVGDAAGYVEPFTGEGMAAALEGAALAAHFAGQPWSPRMAGQWQSAYTNSVRSRQRACARLAWLLRRPRLVNVALRLVERWPAIGVRTAQRISSERTPPMEFAAWAHR